MATLDAERVFADTNVLVYAALGSSSFHACARDVLESLLDRGTEVYASTQVLREFLACTTRSGIMAEPLDPAEALELVEGFRELLLILPDDESVSSRLATLLRGIDCRGKQVHDANIVATMLEAEISVLVTANVKDFKRFKSYISIVDLKEVASQ